MPSVLYGHSAGGGVRKEIIVCGYSCAVVKVKKYIEEILWFLNRSTQVFEKISYFICKFIWSQCCQSTDIRTIENLRFPRLAQEKPRTILEKAHRWTSK